jgi:hypothetical protein
MVAWALKLLNNAQTLEQIFLLQVMLCSAPRIRQKLAVICEH